VVATAGFALVMVAIEYLAFRGQIAFGRAYFHLEGWPLAAAYLALQGGMLASAGLGLWAVLAEDGYLGHRFWTAVVMSAACVADWLGAQAAGWPTIGAAFTAGFTVVALRTWHAILRRISHDLQAKPRMLRYSLIRWALAPGETRKAFRLCILDDLAPASALAAVRGQITPVTVTAEGQTVDLSQMSKADAVRHAFAQLGTYEVPPALAWLTDRGVRIDRSYVYEIGKKLAAARRQEIHAVNAPVPPAIEASKPAPAKAAKAAPVRARKAG
jgi:hypothetical protein